MLWVLSFGLLAAFTVSFIAPSVIGMLFTPPVQFGLNCEPAGTFAMMSLRKSQIIFFVLGAILGGVFYVFLKKRGQNTNAKDSLPSSGQ